MINIEEPSPDYEWAINSEPDFLVVQFPPLAVSQADQAVDAMRALFEARGFQKLTSLVDVEPPVATDCALFKIDPYAAELVIKIGSSATRIRVPHDEPAWSARVFRQRKLIVLATESVIDNGTMLAEGLKREVRAGAVLAAQVPAKTP